MTTSAKAVVVVMSQSVILTGTLQKLDLPMPMCELVTKKRQARLCVTLAVICHSETPASSYQGASVQPVSWHHNGSFVQHGCRDTSSTAETQEDGPWNAPQQLLLLTNRNMRSEEGDLECKEWDIEEAAACFVIGTTKTAERGCRFERGNKICILGCVK